MVLDSVHLTFDQTKTRYIANFSDEQIVQSCDFVQQKSFKNLGGSYNHPL
jgi:hypothetical protein